MMDNELKETLDELHALTKDNHRMLRAIRRGQWMSFFSTVIVWVAVIALPFYLYQQYLQPVIAKFSALSGIPTVSTSGLLGIPSFADVEKMINSYTAGQ